MPTAEETPEVVSATVMRVPSAVAALSANVICTVGLAAAAQQAPPPPPAPSGPLQPLQITEVVTVVGTTPLAGIGVAIDKLPAPVQTATSADLVAAGSLDVPATRSCRLLRGWSLEGQQIGDEPVHFGWLEV